MITVHTVFKSSKQQLLELVQVLPLLMFWLFTSSVKAGSIHLLEAGTLDPSRPVRRDLRWDRLLGLVLERLVAVLVVLASSQER